MVVIAAAMAVTLGAASVPAVDAAPPREQALPLRQTAAPPLQVDQQRSTIVVKLKKAGLLRFLGHEHGIIPGAWSATVRFDPDAPEASTIALQIDSGALIIDSERARRLAAVDPDGPDEDEREQIRADMLSADYLDAASFPTIRFDSVAIRRRSGAALRIDGNLSIHGVTLPIGVDAELTIAGAEYVVRGGFELEQRDFGIEPASIGGVVKVANEVEVRFEIYAALPAAAGR